MIMTNKKDLRIKALEERKSLPPDLQETYSQSIYSQLCHMPDFSGAKEVMTYLDFNNEVSTGLIVNAMIARNNHVYIPVVDKESSLIIPAIIQDTASLKTSHFGILEAPLGKASHAFASCIDLIIVPGVVFDVTGNRIGFGKGYYDKFLRSLNRKVTTIALAYDFQVKEAIPSEPHDFKMDYIVTPSRIITTL